MDNEGPRIQEFCSRNPGVICYINSAIQLVWRIDGVRNFFLQTTRSDIQALQPFTRNSSFYTTNSNNEDFTTSIRHSIVENNTEKEQLTIAAKIPIYKNLLEALMTLFREITKNKESKKPIDMTRIKITTGATVLACFDAFLKNMMTHGGIGVQDDAWDVIRCILKALEYFMNNMIYKIYKEYTFVSTKIISMVGDNEKLEMESTKSYSPNWVVPMHEINTDKTQLSDLITATQQEIELKDFNAPPHKSYEKNTPALFEESNTVIITMSRAETVGGAILETVIIPDKTLIINNKIYTLQGCIIHLGVQGMKDGKPYSYGHYEFYTYDKNGTPTRRISDSTIEDITAEHIIQINTRAYVFLYKCLSNEADLPKANEVEEGDNEENDGEEGDREEDDSEEEEEEGEATPETIAQPFIDHATSRIKELRTKLSSNPKVNVVIAGDPIKNTQLLGTGDAVQQWKVNFNSKYGEKKVDAARQLFITTLQTEFDKLRTGYQERVSYKWFTQSDVDSASSIYYVVWGANADNWIGDHGVKISGGGMADLMGTHKPGKYGIITTPYLENDEINTPNVLRNIVKYNNIWDIVKSNIHRRSEFQNDTYKSQLYKDIVKTRYKNLPKNGVSEDVDQETIITQIRKDLNIHHTKHVEALENANETINDEEIKIIIQHDKEAAEKEVKEVKEVKDVKVKKKVKIKDVKEENEEKETEETQGSVIKLVNSIKNSRLFNANNTITQILKSITDQITGPEEKKLSEYNLSIKNGKITINF